MRDDYVTVSGEREVVQYAQETGSDLIVMGTHGRSGFSHLLRGSVAENVVRRAPCSVLTVRPREPKAVT